MRNKEDNKYIRIKKAVIASASTSIVAGMILMGGSRTVFAETSELSIPAYSQNSDIKAMHLMRRWNSNTKISSLAGNLGLDRAKVKNGLKSGKNLKQILQENGIAPVELQKAFEKSGKKRHNRA